MIFGTASRDGVMVWICLGVFADYTKGAVSFRCRSRDLVLVGVQEYAREPKRG